MATPQKPGGAGGNNEGLKAKACGLSSDAAATSRTSTGIQAWNTKAGWRTKRTFRRKNSLIQWGKNDSPLRWILIRIFYKPNENPRAVANKKRILRKAITRFFACFLRSFCRQSMA